MIYQGAEKAFGQGAQKDPEARRGKIDERRRTHSTLQRGDLSATKDMVLFQQSAKTLTRAVAGTPAPRVLRFAQALRFYAGSDQSG
jgi:hypothetical protein